MSKIRCALVGYGYWGPNIARALENINDVEIAVICDLSAVNLARARERFAQTKVTDKFVEVLKDSSIQAVIIATPASTHFQLAKESLMENKHLLIEKPLTLTVKDALALARLQKKTKRIVMVGHTFEYNQAVRQMKEIVSRKSFGKIYYVYSSRLNLGQIRGDVNVLWNLAPHDISILNFLIGDVPDTVSAVGSSFLRAGIEDVAFLTLRYKNGIMAQIHLSWIDPSKERRMTIVGAKKMLVFDDLNNEMPVKIYDKRVDIGDVARGTSSEYNLKLHSGDIYAPQIKQEEPLLRELEHFFTSIRQKKNPKTDIKNAINVIKILQASQESLDANGIWTKVM